MLRLLRIRECSPRIPAFDQVIVVSGQARKGRPGDRETGRPGERTESGKFGKGEDGKVTIALSSVAMAACSSAGAYVGSVLGCLGSCFLQFENPLLDPNSAQIKAGRSQRRCFCMLSVRGAGSAQYHFHSENLR